MKCDEVCKGKVMKCNVVKCDEVCERRNNEVRKRSCGEVCVRKSDEEVMKCAKGKLRKMCQ